MGYKVTISDGTILEKSIEYVTFNADTPSDDSYCMRNYTINSIAITGKIGAGEKTISLYEWSLLAASNPDCYKEIVVEYIHAGQIIRNVTFSKAFVVDYSESYSKGEGVGHFSILIRQLADIDIECANEATQQSTATETAPTNVVEESSLPQVLETAVTATSIAKKDRPKATDILAKIKMMQDNGTQAPMIANIVGNSGVNENEDDFAGILRGKKVQLPGVKVKEISYTKRNPEETEKLRNAFDSTERKNFLRNLAEDTENLKKAGLSDSDIARMKDGLNPKGWQVHHKLPLDDGGTNAMDNLVLIKNEPYHKTITNFQNTFAKQLETAS